MGVVLPEVLVGLKDSSEEVVSGTLHALGDLVPLLGADVVMGTSRKHVFSNAQPRVCVCTCARTYQLTFDPIGARLYPKETLK